jgi:mannose-6-phosphate isomerase-like protein (cupin superfamily)
MLIRNWRDVTPYVAHNSAIIWQILTHEGQTNAQPPESACLIGIHNFTRHTLQGRMRSDYHDHDDMEQVYYFIKGAGKMLIDDEEYPVAAGDAVHLPPKVKHQLINEGEDQIEHLIISVRVGRR